MLRKPRSEPLIVTVAFGAPTAMIVLASPVNSDSRHHVHPAFVARHTPGTMSVPTRNVPSKSGPCGVFVIRVRSSDQLAQLVDRKNPSVGTIVTMSASLVVRPVMS